MKTPKTKTPAVSFYDLRLGRALRSLKFSNATAATLLGTWCAQVLAQDRDLLRWILEQSRDGYSTSRERKLVNKLRWLSNAEVRSTSIRVLTGWNTYWGAEVVHLELQVTREYRLSIGIPFAAFLTKAGYDSWRDGQRRKLLEKRAEQDKRDRARFEVLKAYFEPPKKKGDK